MKQMARYIVNQVMNAIVLKSDKQVVRIDGFENLSLYLSVCETLSGLCIEQGVVFEAKLARGKFDNLQDAYPFEAQQMLNRGWIDTEDRMTYYRNLTPSDDEKLLVLLLGTDMVADKGGLDDFFAITPNTVDQSVGQNYASLISKELLSLYPDTEVLEKIVNAFFKELFSCVPKNLSRVSEIMDAWEQEAPPPEELVAQLYAHLPEWQIPRIEANVPTLNQLMSSRTRKQSILQRASVFIRGKTYAKLTKATLAGIRKKFEQYEADESTFAVDYPAGQAITSLQELLTCVVNFVSGNHHPALVQKLLHTDFSIIDDVLSTKLRAKGSAIKPHKLEGSPLTVMLQAMIETIHEACKDEDVILERMCFRFIHAHLCGVPSGVNENGQDRQMLLPDIWRSVSIFAGGVIPFIDRESWELADGSDMLTIFQEPEHFFDPDAAEEMLAEGFLGGATGSTHKVSFSVDLYQNEEKTFSKEFLWSIDPNENWMTAFSGLSEMPEDKSYIPFGIMKELNVAFNAKDEDSFAHLVDHSDVHYLQGEKSIVSVIACKAASQEEREEASRFWKLGERFQSFREAVQHRGFYASIDSEAAELIEEYISLARRIAQSSIYSIKMHDYVRLFANAFCIGETSAPVMNDIFADRLIMPPWHPATLEKLSDSMLFVRAGISEWCTNQERTDSIDERIDELVSLSSIHNATDAFVPLPNQVRCFSKTFGFYSLYGQADAKASFVTAQAIQQKEIVFDDDFEDRDMKRMTRESSMILRVLEQYHDTFAKCGTLSLAFVNPTDLQIVVSALYKFITNLRLDQQDTLLSLEVNIVTCNEKHGSRAYLAYWINTAFNADDNVKIKAFLRTYESESEIPRLLASTLDLVFFFDALDTDSGATYAIIENKNISPSCMTECRFPMIFKPSMAARGSKEHLIVITQNQFLAATAHTEMLRAYMDHAAIRPDAHYHLVQSATISENRGRVIRELQSRTVWLACIDSAIDKKTVRELYAEDTGIIGFATGEGSFGQLNMAITCRPDVIIDMLARCRRRLRTMFPSWNDSQLQIAAAHCITKARELDGVSILRALNSDDYDINNYLAYLIASELTSIEAHQINVLIRLDSYRHWFKGEKKEGKKIPDFLHLTADLTTGSHLCFHATVIESKISRSSTMFAEHLPKAKQQVEQGMRILREHFDPKYTEIEHRYWLAQLYRALVFLQGDIDLDDSDFVELSAQLSKMLEGDFEVEWSGQIFACELDNDSYLCNDEYEGIPCLTIGQRAMQNILLKKAPNDPAVLFDAEASVGSEEETADAMMLIEEEPPWNGDENAESAQIILPHSTVSDEVSRNVQEMPSEVSEAAYSTPEASVTADENSQLQQEAVREAYESSLQDIRVLIGTDQAAQPIYWEFGHPQLANRHLLITGGSGQGKTYAIQTFLYELARQKISSVVFDYTDGFLPNKLEPPFASALGDRVVQYIAVVNPIPINPFKRQMIEVAGVSCLEKTVYTAGRFATIMKHVYGFGEQQYSTLYTACKDGIDRYGDQMNFSILRKNLEGISTTYSKTVLSKMQMLFDLDVFDTANAFDWSKITERDGKVTVIQLTNLDRESQTIITEMLMWDAWYALAKTGDPTKPFVVVLDEAQNLSIADGSPAQKILQEGRKFGWSAWFATQFLKGALDSDEISRLYQAAVQLYFKPSSEEINSIAQLLSSDSMPAAKWVSKIKQMQKGQCIVHGNRIGRNGTFGACPATMVKVSSFEERT